jgi:glycine cleavage system H protein
MKKYTKDHEWIEIQANEATVGISEHAQEQLGDIVFVELPEIGKKLSQKDEVAVVESVKAASEVYSPASGTVTAVNDQLSNAPETVNTDPCHNGWFFKLELDNPSELDSLMDETAYQKFIGK